MNKKLINTIAGSRNSKIAHANYESYVTPNEKRHRDFDLLEKNTIESSKKKKKNDAIDVIRKPHAVEKKRVFDIMQEFHNMPAKNKLFRKHFAKMADLDVIMNKLSYSSYKSNYVYAVASLLKKDVKITDTAVQAEMKIIEKQPTLVHPTELLTKLDLDVNRVEFAIQYDIEVKNHIRPNKNGNWEEGTHMVRQTLTSGAFLQQYSLLTNLNEEDYNDNIAPSIRNAPNPDEELQHRLDTFIDKYGSLKTMLPIFTKEPNEITDENWSDLLEMYFETRFLFFDSVVTKYIFVGAEVMSVDKMKNYTNMPLFASQNRLTRIAAEIITQLQPYCPKESNSCISQFFYMGFNSIKDRYDCRLRNLIRYIGMDGYTINELGPLLEQFKINDVAIKIYDCLNQLIYNYRGPKSTSQHTHVLYGRITSTNHLECIYDHRLMHAICQLPIDQNIGYLFKEYDCRIRPFESDNYEYVEYTGTFNIEAIISPSKPIMLMSPDYDLYSLLGFVSNKCNTIISAIKTDANGKLESFLHPLLDVMYVSCEDFNERRSAFTTLRNIYKVDSNNYENLIMPIAIDYSTFQNQSYTSLSIELLNNYAGFDFVKKFASTFTYSIYNHLMSTPICEINYVNVTPEKYATFNETELTKIDICKFYSSLYANATFDFPIYNELAYWEECDILHYTELQAGEYYIYQPFTIAGVEKPCGTYPSQLIEYLLVNKLIMYSSIKFYLKPQNTIDKDFFKKFIEFIYTNDFENESKKKMVNCLTGYIGKRHNMKTQLVMINDLNYANCIVNYYRENKKKGKTISVVPMNGIYYIKQTTVSPLLKNMLPIHRQLLSISWIKLDILLKTFATDACRVLSCRTDCFLFHGPLMNTDYEFVTHANKYKYASLGRYQLEASITLHVGKSKTQSESEYLLDYQCRKSEIIDTYIKRYTEYTISDHINESDYANIDDFYSKLSEQNGFLCDAPPGYGKTRLLSTLLSRRASLDNIYIISATKSSVNNIRDSLLMSNITNNDFLNNNLFTVDSFLGNIKGDTENTYQISNTRIESTNEIHIDEYTLCSPMHYVQLYRLLQRNRKIKFYLYGDNNQTKLPSTRVYDYRTLPLVQYLSGLKRVHLVAKSIRYDDKTDSILKEFLHTGKLPQYFRSKPINSKFREMNICYLNNTVACVNTALTQQRKNENISEYISNDLVICRESIKRDTYTFFNNQLMVFAYKTESIVCLKSRPDVLPYELFISIADFSMYWGHGKSMTVFKTQGHTFTHDYNILDIDFSINGIFAYTKEMMYTALSRCRSIDQIYVEWSDREFQPYGTYTPIIKLDTEKLNQRDKYYLYGILSNDNYVYFGITNNIENRTYQHVCSISESKNMSLYHYLKVNPYEFIVLQEFTLYSRSVILDIEKMYITKYTKTYPDAFKLFNRQHNSIMVMPSQIIIKKFDIHIDKNDALPYILYLNISKCMLSIRSNPKYNDDLPVIEGGLIFTCGSKKINDLDRNNIFRHKCNELVNTYGDIFYIKQDSELDDMLNGTDIMFIDDKKVSVTKSKTKVKQIK